MVLILQVRIYIKILIIFVGALSQKGVDELSRELGIDEAGKINNKEGLYKLLLDEAKKRNINENLIKSLEKELTIYGIPTSSK